MKLPLKEPLSARYLYVSPDNIVHVFMPIVSGTDIGLDNTCKAVLSLQEFFDKGSNSNIKACLRRELFAYKEALEDDIRLLGKESTLAQQKQERLVQIEAYLNVLFNLERHPELNSLNSGFPSYPRPVEAFMQDRVSTNLYSMVLRPTAEDGFLRSEAANPLFSVAHKSASRGIDSSQSNLQQALIEAYTPLTFETRDLKSQVMQQVLAQLQPPHVPVDFERLREILHETMQSMVNVHVDFTQDRQGNPITQQIINSVMDLESQTALPKEYIEALFGYCAGDVFESVIQSPFDYLTSAEQWSIATQFLLGIANVYCFTHGLLHSDTNFGKILDKRLNLSTSLAQTLAKAQKNNVSIEEACLSWLNKHFKRFKLKAPLTAEDIHAIKQDCASRYMQIKDSPHFDEFFVLDTQKKGHFVTHQGAICMSFAAFVSSPLLDVPEELTQPLERARNHANSLDINIPHITPLVQDNITIETASMDKAALQTLYECIDSYQDLELKKTLLAQLKQERPDFKPQINTKQFLQHVAYGQQNEAESLLKNNAALAQELLVARDMEFTDYSGRTFQCSAYEYAWWAKDSHMRFMLEHYMDGDTKRELLKRIQHIEEPIGAGLFKEPRGLAYTQNGREYRSAHFDLTPLKQALRAFIEAYKQKPILTNADWEALDAVWMQVGLSQREVPAHVAQEYCHPGGAFQQVVKKPALLLDASNPDNLKRNLKFYNLKTRSYDAWFAPGSTPAGSGLGASFAILQTNEYSKQTVGGCLWDFFRFRGVESAAGVNLAAIEAIDEARTKDLKLSLERLAVHSISPAPNPQGG
ncbi:TPA: SidC [Legionella pneumophila]|nr:SidC [Legionella pneumophila]HAT8183711.1 SidC [Legionella pneumophila]